MVTITSSFALLAYYCVLVALMGEAAVVHAAAIPGYRRSQVIAAIDSLPSRKGLDALQARTHAKGSEEKKKKQKVSVHYPRTLTCSNTPVEPQS